MMDSYMVLFRDDSLLPGDAPKGFYTQAENSAHAEEQCEAEYRNCGLEVMWVSLCGPITSDKSLAIYLDRAYAEYYEL